MCKCLRRYEKCKKIPSGPRAIIVKNMLLSFSIFLASCAWSVLYFRHYKTLDKSIGKAYTIKELIVKAGLQLNGYKTDTSIVNSSVSIKA